MSEVKNLKNGDYVNVNHGGEIFKAKFIRLNSEETSMQVFARGKLTFYPISCFDSMISADKPVSEILSEAKKKEEDKKEAKKEDAKIEKPKKDLPEKEAKKEMKTKEKKPALAKEKKLAKAPKVSKPKAEKKEKTPAVDRSALVKQIKKGDLTPKQIMKETGASKTDMIAAMLLNGIEADVIKKDLGLSITQFVYNVRGKLYASGELKKA